VETDSILVVDADAVLTLPIALQRLKAVPPNGREILKTFCSVQASQSHSSLIFDMYEFNDTFIAEQPCCPRIF
jgi:hypothetical protein